MKHIAAILLLGIFSFNIIGYRIVYDYMAQRADINLELALDKEDYSDAELISIKQPIQLPYYTNSKAYQRQDGEVNINGSIYKYVKCRIYNDSLEMLCIPHTSKMQIENSKDRFFKLVNDFQQAGSKNKKAPEQNKSILSEFEEVYRQKLAAPSAHIISQCFYDNVPGIAWVLIDSAERPPDPSFPEC
jgi:hypothetical protein